jgi:hypothetical protein
MKEHVMSATYKIVIGEPEEKKQEGASSMGMLSILSIRKIGHLVSSKELNTVMNLWVP